MNIRPVGPYIITLVKSYNEFKEQGATLEVEITAQILMSRITYRRCLEANYPDIYKELQESDYLYVRRD